MPAAFAGAIGGAFQRGEVEAAGMRKDIADAARALRVKPVQLRIGRIGVRHDDGAERQSQRGAELQLAAMAAGTIADLPPRLAREAHDWTLRPKRSEANFAYYARRAYRNHPDALSN